MKSLKEIRIHNQIKNLIDNTTASACITSLFSRLIYRQLITNGIHTANIYLTSDAKKHLQYSDINNGFISIDYALNDEVQACINNKNDLKRIYFDIVYHSLRNVGVNKHWDVNVLDDSYRQCLQNGITNEWWFKNKLISSPNRQYHIGLLHVYEINDFKIYIVLFDSKKNEVTRSLILKYHFETFNIERLNWIDNNSISFKFVGPTKNFIYTIDDLINGNVLMIQNKIHLAFK